MQSFENPRPAVALALSVALWFTAGCSQRMPGVAETPPPEVGVAQPVEREFSDFVEFTGLTEAAQHVEMRARVSGYLLSVNFDEGEDVTKDQLLFEIDPRPFEAALDAAQAQIAQWDASLDKATATAARITKLRESEAASPEQLDEAVAEQAVAQANLDGAKAAVRDAELNLGFTKIKAPFDGRVSRAMIKAGNLISPGALDTTPLTTVVSIDPMHVYFDMDERTFLMLQRQGRKDQPEREGKRPKLSEMKWPAFIGLAIEKGFPHEGVLDFVDNRVDPGTGTLKVRAAFDNKDRLLTAGLFVRIRLPTGEPRKRVLVPERAIGTDQGQKYLMVVNDDDTTEYRPVTLGSRTEDGLRTIDEGLQAGERIVVDGIQRVRPGMKVNPQALDAAANEEQTADVPADAPDESEGESAS